MWFITTFLFNLLLVFEHYVWIACKLSIMLNMCSFMLYAIVYAIVNA